MRARSTPLGFGYFYCPNLRQLAASRGTQCRKSCCGPLKGKSHQKQKCLQHGWVGFHPGGCRNDWGMGGKSSAFLQHVIPQNSAPFWYPSPTVSQNMWTSVACALARGVAEMMLYSTRNASVSDSVACAPVFFHSASNGHSLQHSTSSSGPLVLWSSGDMPAPPSMRRQHPEAARVPSETGNSGVMDIDAPFLGDIEPSVVAEIHVVPGARVMRLPSGSVAPLVVHPVS